MSDKPVIERGISYADIYTPLSVAKKEIRRRWNDEKLKEKIEDFLGELPGVFKTNEPVAILSRDIISPNKEFYYFLDLVKEVGLKPEFLEYLNGKFVARNFNKYHLCRMFFHDGRGRNGGDRLSTLKVVDFNKSEGRKMKNIKTIGGKNFVSFHHDILKKSVPEIKVGKINDFSAWFDKHRKMSSHYYLHYLALFLSHGVLFDNFLSKNNEGDFTDKKIIPSFRRLEKIFGLKPLIVPLTPIEDECELYWWCYPESVKKCSEDLIK